MKKVIDVKFLKDNNLIIFEGICGSRAYGTSLPTSDTDIRGVFILPEEYVLGMGYIDQVSDKKNDIVYYEIKRFLELLSSNNPNILEILNLPEDCIRIKDPIFDMILDQKEQFITKQCKNSFAGYAIGQIKKARGLNKKINWEENSMTRQTVLDFCYVLNGNDTVPLKTWLIFPQETVGLAKIDHAHDLYTMYAAPNDVEWGIVSDEEKAADVQLWSVPKDAEILGYLTFNKDAYSTHCKRYAEYKEWLKNRNEDRFKMNKEHGKQYDAKNLMHTFRLLNMASEIAEGKIIVRRPDAEIETLIKIRKGEYDYAQLLSEAEVLISKLDELFDSSDLPNKVDGEFIDNLLITIRKLRYR